MSRNSIHNPDLISDEMIQAALDALQDISDSQGDDERAWATNLCMRILTINDCEGLRK